MKTRIQELRKDQKVTQMELAESVGVTRQTIISLENGRYKASLVLAHKIAQFFGVTIEDIFIFDQEEKTEISHFTVLSGISGTGCFTFGRKLLGGQDQ